MSAHGSDAVRMICEHWATMSLEEFREVMTELRDGKVAAWRDYFERSHLRLR